MSNTPVRYHSYLICLWQERASDETDAYGWHAEVEHIQTGDRQRFGSLAELWQYLRRQMPSGDGDPSGSGDEA
jgi:hypothetical protein